MFYTPILNVEEISKATQYANNLHKMIEVNVDTESEIAVYDRYLNTLIDNDLKYNNKYKDKKEFNKFVKDFENTLDNDYKWKCLLFYEEEERIRKMITTITTRTRTEDRLERSDLLRNRLILHDSVADDLDETVVIDYEKNNTATTTTAAKNAKDNNNDDGIYSNLQSYSSKLLDSKSSSNSKETYENDLLTVTNDTNTNTNHDKRGSRDAEISNITELVLVASLESLSDRNDSGFYSTHNSMKKINKN